MTNCEAQEGCREVERENISDKIWIPLYLFLPQYIFFLPVDFAEVVKLIVGKTELSLEMPILLWIGTPRPFTFAIKHHRKG